YTVQPNQETMRIEVTEGEDEDPEYVNIIGEGTVTLPPGLPDSSPVQFKISYDKNGIVQLVAKDMTNDLELGEIIIERKGNLTQLELEEKREDLLTIEVE